MAKTVMVECFETGTYKKHRYELMIFENLFVFPQYYELLDYFAEEAVELYEEAGITGKEFDIDSTFLNTDEFVNEIHPEITTLTFFVY